MQFAIQPFPIYLLFPQSDDIKALSLKSLILLREEEKKESHLPVTIIRLKKDFQQRII